MADSEIVSDIEHALQLIRTLRQTVERQEAALEAQRQVRAMLIADRSRLDGALTEIIGICSTTHNQRPFTALSRIDGIAREAQRLVSKTAARSMDTTLG